MSSHQYPEHYNTGIKPLQDEKENCSYDRISPFVRWFLMNPQTFSEHDQKFQSVGLKTPKLVGTKYVPYIKGLIRYQLRLVLPK